MANKEYKKVKKNLKINSSYCQKHILLKLSMHKIPFFNTSAINSTKLYQDIASSHRLKSTFNFLEKNRTRNWYQDYIPLNLLIYHQWISALSDFSKMYHPDIYQRPFIHELQKTKVYRNSPKYLLQNYKRHYWHENYGVQWQLFNWVSVIVLWNVFLIPMSLFTLIGHFFSAENLLHNNEKYFTLGLAVIFYIFVIISF